MNKNSNFYEKLRKKIDAWKPVENEAIHLREYILYGPDLFHFIWKLSSDSCVSHQMRYHLKGVVAYFIIPFDIIPELLTGPVGYIDDIVLGILVLNSMLEKISQENIESYWRGNFCLRTMIEKSAEHAQLLLGIKRFKKVKDYFLSVVRRH